MIILSTIIVVITYIFIWNDHTYINSYCRLSLLIKCHYYVLIHTCIHIVFLHTKYTLVLSTFMHTIGILRFPENSTIYSNGGYFISGFDPSCIYNMNMYISLNYFQSFSSCTYIYTTFYFIILCTASYNLLFI